MSRRSHLLELASAAIALGAAAPTLWMGYLRDDWLFLWSRLDPQSAPADATGVFWRPLAELWWTLTVPLGGEDPFTGHLFQFLLAAALLFSLYRLGRALSLGSEATAWLMLLVGTHAALLELRVWASGSNGLLALTLGVFALERWVRGRAALSYLLLLAAMAARIDAVLLLFFLPALRAPGRRAGAWIFSMALVGGAVAAAITLSSASTWTTFAPSQAGRALRLLFLPSGPVLPPGVATVLAAVGIVAIAWTLRREFLRHSHGLAVLALLLAAALLPWAFGGRYLAFGVLALALSIARAAPHRRWARVTLGLWVALQLASAWFGNGARTLRERSHAETGLYFMAKSLEETPETLWLVSPPPMGWTDSEADAENVVSAARREEMTVRFVAKESELGDAAPSLRFRDGVWSR